MASNGTDMRGMTGPEIAVLIKDGTITRKAAEKFVAERAVVKLGKAFDKLSA